MDPKIEAEALEWVNQNREERGLPLLERLAQGKPRSAMNCPIANSLCGQDKPLVSISSVKIIFAGEYGEDMEFLEPTPDPLVNYMREFDRL